MNHVGPAKDRISSWRGTRREGGREDRERFTSVSHDTGNELISIQKTDGERAQEISWSSHGKLGRG